MTRTDPRHQAFVHIDVRVQCFRLIRVDMYEWGTEHSDVNIGMPRELVRIARAPYCL
jgi:hypothetical protein